MTQFMNEDVKSDNYEIFRVKIYTQWMLSGDCHVQKLQNHEDS